MRRGFTDRQCPKCGGNVFVDHDSHYASSKKDCLGWYEWCLQCGYRSYILTDIVFTEEYEVVHSIKEPVKV